MPGSVAFVRNRGSVKPQVPRHHWKDLKAHEQFFDFVAEKLSIKTPEQWYNVSFRDIERQGGGGLMHMFYGRSLYKALSTVYPTYNWLPWRFNKVPKNYWNDEQNVVAYLQWLQQHLGINTMSDWNAIPRDLLSINLLKRYGGLIPMLKRYFPDHTWNVPEVLKHKSQTHLHKQITYLFPKHTILTDYTHPSLTFDATNKNMQLDIFLPDLNLAFEYQGQLHYSFVPVYGDHTDLSKRDSEKKTACAAIGKYPVMVDNMEGVTLIEIPFWWDRSQSSLQATIHKYRPEIFAGQTIKGKPIEDKVPSSFRSKVLKDSARFKLREILKPLRPTLESVIQAFGDTNSSLNVKGWYFSDKIRGFRCFWDGEDQILRPNGTKIRVPDQVKAIFPNEPLDILISSDNVHDCYLVGCQPTAEVENTLRKGGFTIYALDVPSHDHLPFKRRLELLKDLIAARLKTDNNNETWIPQLKIIQHQVCNSAEQLKDAVTHSSNGVVMYRPDSVYHEPQMLLWTRREDKALVLSHQQDGILCKLPEGQELSVKTDLRPALACVVTVSYDDNMQHARLEQVRPDVDWDDISKSIFPYTIGFGKGVPKCRGCGKILKDRSQLRIHVRGTFTPLSQTPFPVKYSMCLNLACVKKAQAGKSKSGVYLPPFDNQIGIPAHIKAVLNREELPGLNNVIWKDV